MKYPDLTQNKELWINWYQINNSQEIYSWEMSKCVPNLCQKNKYKLEIEFKSRANFRF